MLPSHLHPVSRRRAPRPHAGARAASGFTLIELVVILGVIGILVALAASSMSGYAQNQRLTSSAREIATMFSFARGEAIRTGRIHLVSVGIDVDGNPVAGGDAQVHDDGLIGDADQNCAVDAGEAMTNFDLEEGVTLGVTFATAKVPSDTGLGALGTSSFEDADGNAASWVMFRPEGTPLAYSADCSTGATGTGGGAIYLTNGARDVAVVVSPLGSTRTHSWDAASAAWSQ